jgi:hypothetical protein
MYVNAQIITHCGIRWQVALGSGVDLTRKATKLRNSKAFSRVVIHHIEVHHIRRVTPRMNASSCLGKVRLRG